jgi:hypothetical protein
MPSSASTRLLLNLQASGENNNVWGDRLNAQVFQLIDDAIAGRTAFTLSGTKTLTSTNFVTNEARSAFLDITSGTGGTVTIPGYEKLYLVRNGTSGDVTFTTGGATNATVKAGNVQFVVSDGTNVYLAKERDLGSDLLTTSATPTADGHLTRKAYVDGLNSTESAARIAGDAATLTTAEAYTDATSFRAGSLPGGGSTGQYVRQIAGPSADWHDPFPQTAGGTYDGKVLTSVAGAPTWALALPAQSGNSGKLLTSDGANPSWTYIGGPALTLFGDGSDGNVTVSGAVTLSRDMFYANLTLTTGAAISTNGYRIFVSGTLDLTAAPAGAIKNNGGNGGAGTNSTSVSSNAGGAAGTAAPGNTVGASGAGAAGGAGLDTVGGGGSGGSSAQNGGAAGPGGGGGNGSGGTGGTAGGAGTVTAAIPRLLRTALTASDQSTTLVTPGASGGSGGGGCGDGGSTRDGGGGGGSGAGGGLVQINARYITRGAGTATAAIQAKGGAGGAGGAVSSSNAGGGGGGAGGGGGWVVVACEVLQGSAAATAVDVSGGQAGSGGNGNGTGTGGKAGGYGASGRLTVAQLSTATVTDSGVGSAGVVVNNAGTTGGVAATVPVTQYSL